MAKVRKVLLWILVVFFVYAIFTSPEKAADIVANIWGVILDGFNALIRFFNSLLAR